MTDMRKIVKDMGYDVTGAHAPSAEKLSSLVKDSNPKDAIGIAKVPASVLSAPVMAEVGLAMMEGALKYGRHNYRVIGVRASVYYDAQKRHMDSWWEGEDIDPDTKEAQLHHITKAISTLMVLRDAMINDKWVDDRPPPSPKGWMQRLNEKAKILLAMYPNPKEPYTALNALNEKVEQ